jgi:hypothetical protein
MQVEKMASFIPQVAVEPMGTILSVTGFPG